MSMRPHLFSVARLSAQALFDKKSDARPYDALIAAVGFERRARYISEAAPRGTFSRTWAYEYSHNRVLSYDDNRTHFESAGKVFSESDSGYRKHLALQIGARGEEARVALRQLGINGPVRFAVDISSMDRDRLARTVQAFAFDQSHTTEVDFLYSLAQFDSSLVGNEGRVVVNRSVEGLEGWTASPSLPAVCLIGAGFESRLALAALETLEPAETVILLPRGREEEYDRLVDERNSIILADKSNRSYEYRVDDPYGTLMDLEATTASLSRENRVVVVPLGPKIFALLAILTGLAHDTNVSVWRLSADVDRRPEDRFASGIVVGLRVAFAGLGRTDI